MGTKADSYSDSSAGLTTGTDKKQARGPLLAYAEYSYLLLGLSLGEREEGPVAGPGKSKVSR